MAVTVRTFDTLTPDDHNAPALLVPTDEGPILAWANHETDDALVWLKVGTVNEDFTSLGAAQDETFDESATYAQLYRVSGDNLILFARYQKPLLDPRYRWGFIESANYGATWGAHTPLFYAPVKDPHFYMDTTRTGDVVRCVFHQFGIGDIYYLEIDLSTGDIDRSNGTNVANLDGTGLPYTLTNSDRILDITSGAARVLDVSAASDPEVVYVDWTTTEDATYKYIKRTAGTWGSPKTIVAAGQGLGVQSDRYYGGASFPNPASGGTVYLAREDDGDWFVEKHVTADGGDTWTPTELSTGLTPLVRPYCPVGFSTGPEVFWHKVTSYASYSSWVASLHCYPNP